MFHLTFINTSKAFCAHLSLSFNCYFHFSFYIKVSAISSIRLTVLSYLQFLQVRAQSQWRWPPVVQEAKRESWMDPQVQKWLMVLLKNHCNVRVISLIRLRGVLLTDSEKRTCNMLILQEYEITIT